MEQGVGTSVVRKRNLLLHTKPQLQIAEDFSSFLVRNDTLFISSEHLWCYHRSQANCDVTIIFHLAYLFIFGDGIKSN